MKIRCLSCGHSEKPTLDLFVKLIGGALPIGGFWAWVTYLFAGTGLAFPMVTAMVVGGTTMLVFRDQIVMWLINAGYSCPKCGKVDWEA